MKDFLLLAGLLLALILGLIILNKNSYRGVDTVFPRPIEEVENSRDDKTIVLKLREQVTFNDVIIEPWAVTEDSRCPQDVQCIQAGRVKVAINVLDKNSIFVRTAELELGVPLTVNDVTIILTKVTPNPISTAKIIDDQYRFTFDFVAVK